MMIVPDCVRLSSTQDWKAPGDDGEVDAEVDAEDDARNVAVRDAEGKSGDDAANNAWG